MMAVVATMVFVGAATLAMAAMWATLAPQWQRVARLAAGHFEQPLYSCDQLARAEHRVPVRRWAVAPVSVPTLQLRAA